MRKILGLVLFTVLCSGAVAGDIWRGLFEEKLREANRGDSTAQFDVGSMYQNGRGVEADRGRAIEWYRKSAAQGNPQAVSRLELMKASEERFARTGVLAAQGDADSQYDLGNMYENGVGTAIDYRQAREWYEKAAQAGHATAAFKLGFLYHEGIGTRGDDKAAFRWFSEAARRGSAPAQYYLGKLHASGSGVRRDYARALEWYTKAAEGGFDKARGEIIDVTERMKQPPASADRPQETATRKDAGEGEDSAGDTEARPVVPEKKLIAQPVYVPLARAHHKDRGRHDPELMESLMLTSWSRRARPVSYLPSAITTCRSRDREITCFSDDQTRNSGGNTVRFKTKAILSDFSGDGSFLVRYRNLVVNSTLTGGTAAAQPGAFDDDDGGPGHVVDTGWGMPHTAECTLLDEFTITCTKDRSRTVEITSQQSLANGR